jgi:hypothetical protein
MNGYQLSAKPFSEREIDLQRVSDFHAVLLGMAAHDLRQPLQVIQSTYEWLSGRFDAEADRMRLQRGEGAVWIPLARCDRRAEGNVTLRGRWTRGEDHGCLSRQPKGVVRL